MENEAEQLELLLEEEEFPITWKEIIRDPESAFTLACIVLVILLMIFW